MNLARGSILLVLVCVGTNAFGDQVREFSLEKKVRRSAVVIVGRAVSMAPGPKADALPQYARVSIDMVLKGTPLQSIDVLSKGGIAELNPDIVATLAAYIYSF